MSGPAELMTTSQHDAPEEGAPEKAEAGGMTIAEIRKLPALVGAALTARALGCSQRALYDYISAGDLPEGLTPLMIRKTVKFRSADIMRVLNIPID